MRDRDSTIVRQAARLLAALVLTGCAQAPPQALGTLEYDRIVLPSPAAERIVAVTVREGQRVHAGQVLLRLEATDPLLRRLVPPLQLGTVSLDLSVIILLIVMVVLQQVAVTLA